MLPRMIHVAVWLAVVAVGWGLSLGSSGCNSKNACSSCMQTPNCMWCDRPGNFTREEGTSLPRCIQDTDNAASKWREACGPYDIHEPKNVSEECNFHGTYQCGECLCDVGYIGRQCECHHSTMMDDSSCRETSTSTVCSGRGTCTCGECFCNERHNYLEHISGRFCECTNFLCSRWNGMLCGGPHHGECLCNKCLCKPGWIGDDCMCLDRTDNCINPEDGEVCSGKGVCECNQCKCYESYSGKFCEDCPLCRGKCTDFKLCVQCQVFQTGNYTEEECQTKCTTFTDVTVINASEITAAMGGMHHCSFLDENDCRFLFAYNYDEDRRPKVYVQRVLQCPPPMRRSMGHSIAVETSLSFFTGAIVAYLSIIPLIGII